MNHRLFAILIVVCLAVAEAGCASEAQRERNRREMLLPRQTGSNLDRHIIVSETSQTKKKKKRREPKRDSSKPPAPERTEEASPTPPDRFR
jgi:hypothetical protein